MHDGLRMHRHINAVIGPEDEDEDSGEEESGEESEEESDEEE